MKPSSIKLRLTKGKRPSDDAASTTSFYNIISPFELRFRAAVRHGRRASRGGPGLLTRGPASLRSAPLRSRGQGRRKQSGGAWRSSTISKLNFCSSVLWVDGKGRGHAEGGGRNCFRRNNATHGLPEKTTSGRNTTHETYAAFKVKSARINRRETGDRSHSHRVTRCNTKRTLNTK